MDRPLACDMKNISTLDLLHNGKTRLKNSNKTGISVIIQIIVVSLLIKTYICVRLLLSFAQTITFNAVNVHGKPATLLRWVIHSWKRATGCDRV